ncbi:hypothetical protein QBC42DRAFT_279268 [Cladorrhinum samala]|uniref:CorA-like transporter domain-containing protein n=1 Tax=Cladorrhinum samala TaxID=585594 RepID=A0AAV9H9U8_9PEZI|nr:hypothetical protein QBC42DRAFT_279268 [Cladorrhinum samala]
MNQLEKWNIPPSWAPSSLAAARHHETLLMLQRLERCRDRVFVSEPARVALEAFSSEGASGQCLTTSETFDEFLRGKNGSNETVAFFITAKTTWGRLRLSYPMFTTVAAALFIPPAFFDLLTTFGHRAAETDAVYQASFSSFQDGTHATESRDRFDLCYNLRYVELNERSEGDPWSFRNFAVLHACSLGSHVDAETWGSETKGCPDSWILVSIPPPMRDYMQHMLRESREQESKGHQILWHAHLVGAMLGNWRSYLNFLDETHQQIVDNVTLSTLRTRKTPSGKAVLSGGLVDGQLELDVRKCQDLGYLHSRIQKALCILRSYGGVLGGIMCHARGLRKQGRISNDVVQALSVALNRHGDIVAGHIRHAEGLLASSNFTAQSIFHLRESHGSARLEEKMEQLGKSLEAAGTLWERMVALNKQFTRDSGATRMAALVALVYSSAGMVASIFNSNLIQASSPQNEFFVRGKEMVIFVSSAFSLVFLTMLYMWVSERREQRKLQNLKL